MLGGRKDRGSGLAAAAATGTVVVECADQTHGSECVVPGTVLGARKNEASGEGNGGRLPCRAVGARFATLSTAARNRFGFLSAVS